MNAPDGSDPELHVVPPPCRPADSPHMHCPVLSASPAVTSAMPSYAPGLRGAVRRAARDTGRGRQWGRAARAEEKLSPAWVVAARAAPSVTHSSRTRPSSSGPVGEVQVATDLVQHLDTVQHITVQYSTVQVQYSTGGTSPEVRIRAQHCPDRLSSEQSRADTKRTIFYCSGGSCR